MNASLKIGQTVMWTSQARGGVTNKTGTIIAVVLPSQYPEDALDSGAPGWAPLYRANNIKHSGKPRSAVSYVVAVKVGSQPDKNKPALYWPNARKLITPSTLDIVPSATAEASEVTAAA